MAEVKYIDLARLTQYDTLIKKYSDDADKVVDAKSLKCIAVVGDNIYFFKQDTVPMTEGGQVDTSKAATYVTISSSDVEALKTLMGDATLTTEATTITAAINELDSHADANASNIGTLTDLTTDAKGTLVAAINEVDAHADANATAIGKAKSGETAGTGLTGRIESLEDKVGDKSVVARIQELDKADTAVDHQFVTAVSEEDGVITVSRAALVAADIPTLTLEKISDAGTVAASDVATVAIGTTDEAKNAIPTVGQVETYVAAEIKDLEGAMHFKAVVERNEGETDAQAIARVVTDPKAGDVVVISDNGKEYIYTGSAWREIGDEGLYVQKSQTIAGIDQEDAITADELKTALDIDDIETAIGNETAGETPATGIYKRIEDLEAIETAEDAIKKLDATVTTVTEQEANPVLNISVTETDGKLTAISATVKANTFEAYGAAASVQGDTEATVEDLEDRLDEIKTAEESDISGLFTQA